MNDHAVARWRKATGAISNKGYLSTMTKIILDFCGGFAYNIVKPFLRVKFLQC
jgi:hypothetical protein